MPKGLNRLAIAVFLGCVIAKVRDHLRNAVDLCGTRHDQVGQGTDAIGLQLAQHLLHAEHLRRVVQTIGEVGRRPAGERRLHALA